MAITLLYLYVCPFTDLCVQQRCLSHCAGKIEMVHKTRWVHLIEVHIVRWCLLHCWSWSNICWFSWCDVAVSLASVRKSIDCDVFCWLLFFIFGFWYHFVIGFVVDVEVDWSLCDKFIFEFLCIKSIKSQLEFDESWNCLITS